MLRTLYAIWIFIKIILIVHKSKFWQSQNHTKQKQKRKNILNAHYECDTPLCILHFHLLVVIYYLFSCICMCIVILANKQTIASDGAFLWFIIKYSTIIVKFAFIFDNVEFFGNNVSFLESKQLSNFKRMGISQCFTNMAHVRILLIFGLFVFVSSLSLPFIRLHLHSDTRVDARTCAGLSFASVITTNLDQWTFSVIKFWHPS